MQVILLLILLENYSPEQKARFLSYVICSEDAVISQLILFYCA